MSPQWFRSGYSRPDGNCRSPTRIWRDQSLAAEISEEETAMEVDHLASMVFNASSEAPTLQNKKVYAYPNQSITNVLDI